MTASRPRRGEHRDRGSGTILVLVLALLILVATSGIGLLGAAVAGLHRAQSAADLAALAAAADGLRGAETACAAADRIARSNGARLRACALRRDVADVTVAVPLHGPLARLPPVPARALAGPDRGLAP